MPEQIMQDELKPCPFCGNDGSGPIEDALHVVHVEDCDRYTVQCDKCTATMGYSDDKDKAIAAWNTRAPQRNEVIEYCQIDTSMESGPNNCFYCEEPMPEKGRRKCRTLKDESQ